ncbi:MAG: hypothetical protein IPM56_07115 [Ignavibacteriales bacterium]|nr:MAG: hypothetical protein IPM56_07115 [Ignavibacteriales bacterium]
MKFISIKNLLLFIFLSALYAGCSKDSPSQPIVPPQLSIDSVSCSDNAEITINKMMLQNNVWGKGSITNYQQCIRVIKNDTSTIFQWQWSWPDVTNNVKAYPEIIFGLKPFGGSSTTESLPKKIQEITECVVSASQCSTDIFGEGNLAYDIWITDSESPTQNNIKSEIMIWLKYIGQQPAGSFVERLNIGNQDYDFYSGNNGTWDYHAFLKVNQSDLDSTNIKSFMDYLVMNSYISTDQYLSSIEFGNEIIKGSGNTVLKDYQVRLK